MNVHVLLNLLNSLRKKDKMLGKPRIVFLFRNEFSKSIIRKHECKLLFIK